MCLVLPSMLVSERSEDVAVIEGWHGLCSSSQDVMSVLMWRIHEHLKDTFIICFFLLVFVIGYNDLTGSLPKEFFVMTHLTHLSLRTYHGCVLRNK